MLSYMTMVDSEPTGFNIVGGDVLNKFRKKTPKIHYLGFDGGFVCVLGIFFGWLVGWFEVFSLHL